MKAVLYNKPQSDRNNDQLSLLRVIISDKFTRLDFGYQATSYYVRGGWVTMNGEAFIRLKNSEEKLFLTEATNIPIEPVKHNFNSTAESLYFCLYFPPIPKNKSLEFDFIEKEPNTPTLFSFYNIKIDKNKAILIKTQQSLMSNI